MLFELELISLVEPIERIEIDPAEFGMAGVKIEQIAGGDSRHNAEMVRNVILAKDNGPARDIVLLNAAAAIVVADLAETLKEAFKLAQESIDNGKAAECLDKMIKISNA